VFEGHVIKPVSKKQSDLTVYFVSDTVPVLARKTAVKVAVLSYRIKTFYSGKKSSLTGQSKHLDY
jgi:hypothetical protein